MRKIEVNNSLEIKMEHMPRWQKKKNLNQEHLTLCYEKPLGKSSNGLH